MIERTDNLVNSSIKPARNAKGQLLPNQPSLNPAGKPKGAKHFSTLFMEALKKEIELKTKNGSIKMKAGDAMVQAMINQAIKGNVHAFDSVADRVDGRPMQSMEVEVTAMPTPIYQGMSIKKKPKTGK